MGVIMSIGTKLVAAACAALFATSCATQREKVSWPAGMFGVDGWNGTNPDKQPIVQVDGEVATPLRAVVGPRLAYCVPSAYESYGDYGADPQFHENHRVRGYLGSSVLTGMLPPGLSMDGNGTISGIPLQRGNWITTLQAGTYNCAGKIAGGFTQQIIFKIGGSGVVHQ
jgi:hypothetical protein